MSPAVPPPSKAASLLFYSCSSLLVINYTTATVLEVFDLTQSYYKDRAVDGLEAQEDDDMALLRKAQFMERADLYIIHLKERHEQQRMGLHGDFLKDMRGQLTMQAAEMGSSLGELL